MTRNPMFAALIGIAATIISACSSSLTNPPEFPSVSQHQSHAVSGVRSDGIATIEKELGAASAFNFSVLGLGSPTNVSITGPSAVLGLHDVGVAGTSTFSMSDGVITRHLVITSTDTVQTSGPAKIEEGIVVNNSRLAAATAAAIGASNYYAGFPASSGTPNDINISNPSGDLTIDAVHPTTVIDLQDLILNGGSTVTLRSPSAGYQFIVNITGRLVIQGGSSVLVSGIDPPQVLFNVIGTGQAVAMGGGTQHGVPTSKLMGVLLATERDIALSPGLVQPEVIGGGQQITITSGGQVIDHDR